MSTKPPTAAQRNILATIKNGGVTRRRYTSESPRSVTYTWAWATPGGQTIPERTIRAFVKNGWVRVIPGDLKPGVPADTDPLTIAIKGLREPDRLEWVPAKEATP